MKSIRNINALIFFYLKKGIVSPENARKQSIGRVRDHAQHEHARHECHVENDHKQHTDSHQQ